MFGSRKAKKTDVLSHWYTLVDYFNIPCENFYEAVERELDRRKVPNLSISRVLYAEGGVLSANRQYLRLKREKLVFDICAAPFGVSYFFSMRFAELRTGVSWWQWGALALGLLLIVGLCVYFMGFIIGIFLGATLSAGCLWFLIDLRKETYYRQDTRLMYLEVVNAVVRQKIAEFTSAQGINLLNIQQHSPLMDDLYRPTQMRIEPAEAPVEPVPA